MPKGTERSAARGLAKMKGRKTKAMKAKALKLAQQRRGRREKKYGVRSRRAVAKVKRGG